MANTSSGLSPQMKLFVKLLKQSVNNLCNSITHDKPIKPVDSSAFNQTNHQAAQDSSGHPHAIVLCHNGHHEVNSPPLLNKTRNTSLHAQAMTTTTLTEYSLVDVSTANQHTSRNSTQHQCEQTTLSASNSTPFHVNPLYGKIHGIAAISDYIHQMKLTTITLISTPDSHTPKADQHNPPRKHKEDINTSIKSTSEMNNLCCEQSTLDYVPHHAQYLGSAKCITYHQQKLNFSIRTNDTLHSLHILLMIIHCRSQ